MRLAKYNQIFLLLVSIFLLVGAAHAQEGGLYDSVQAEDIPPDIAIEWIDTLYSRIQADAVNAPAAARLYGYAAVAMYEATLPGMADNNTLIGQIEHLTDLPWPTEDAIHDWPAVIDATMATVLAGLFPDSPDSQQAFADLRDQSLAERASEVSQEVIDRSTAFGEIMGQALLEWISGDGYAERVTAYTPVPNDPSTWVPTEEDMVAVEPGWGAIRPLILENADVCANLNDVPFSTDENSTFYAQAVEVMTVGQNLSDEQIEIAEFWVDTPGITGTPAGHWMRIASVMIRQEGFMLNRATELYAMIGLGVMDAFISSWSLKYQYPLLRPVTYINAYINPRWRPYIESPGFPEYPSGHSVVSGAAAALLTSYFEGARAFSSTNETITLGTITRSFTSFWAATSESAISRLYGGIHYRAAIENGVIQGRCVGEYIADRVRLNPVRQGE
ncbi:MAG: vanadium-dependent haloperoxidase [Chloroflexi bacterium]|nr:vanadium-dependent haloperoxidase [Chloroflexota bacterium]